MCGIGYVWLHQTRIAVFTSCDTSTLQRMRARRKTESIPFLVSMIAVVCFDVFGASCFFKRLVFRTPFSLCLSSYLKNFVSRIFFFFSQNPNQSSTTLSLSDAKFTLKSCWLLFHDFWSAACCAKFKCELPWLLWDCKMPLFKSECWQVIGLFRLFCHCFRLSIKLLSWN